MTSTSSDDASPASPCQRRCCLSEQDICQGCGRTLQEILDWGLADAARRREICIAAAERKRQMPELPDSFFF